MRAGLSIGAASALPGAARAAIAPQAVADRVIVTKTERRLYLLRDGEILHSYRVALGRVPKGTKIYQGDGRTPEGDYTLTEFNAGSRFYRSIRVSYPNEQDRARADGRRRRHAARTGTGAARLRARAQAVQLDQRLHRRHR